MIRFVLCAVALAAGIWLIDLSFSSDAKPTEKPKPTVAKIRMWPALTSHLPSKYQTPEADRILGGLTFAEKRILARAMDPIVEAYQAQDDECEAQTLAHLAGFDGPPSACDLYLVRQQQVQQLQASVSPAVWSRIDPYADWLVVGGLDRQ